MNTRAAAKRFIKAPFRALGFDLVRWRTPNQTCANELETGPDFSVFVDTKKQ
jgi:hypothetical protein